MLATNIYFKTWWLSLLMKLIASRKWYVLCFKGMQYLKMYFLNTFYFGLYYFLMLYWPVYKIRTAKII